MPAIHEHETFEVVRKDFESVAREAFEPSDDEAFAVVEDLRGEEMLTNGNVTVVPWVYRCRHVGDFNGLFPTQRELQIDGVTIVDDRGGETLLRRYIDWGGVIAQLGLDVSWRLPVTEDEYRRAPDS